MRRRPLGNIGLTVSELALGTWGLSGDGYGAVAESEQDRVIDRALQVGITTFETADAYAHGDMERRLGARLASHPRTEVVTKIGTDRIPTPARKRFEPEFLRGAVARCQERLRRDPLDVVLLHNPSPDTLARGEATGLLAELVGSRTLRSWGVSAGDAETACAALRAGAPVLQLAYNAFHPSDLAAVAEECEQKRVGVLARSVLGHGLLTGHWAVDKQFAEGDHRAERWTPDELRRRLRQLVALRPLVGGPVLTLRAAALRYVLCSSAVSTAVIGPRASLQLDQLVREAGRGPPYLEDAQLTALAARLSEVGIEP